MLIDEIINDDKVSLGKVKMSADDIKEMGQVPYPLHKTASFYQFVGPPASGKTHLWCNMILKKKRFYNQLFENVHIFSSSLHTVSEKIGLEPDRLHDGLDMGELQAVLDSVPRDERCLIILDDVISSVTKNLKPFLKMVLNRRHVGKGCHVWLISQKLNMIPLELRACSNGLFMFKTPNGSELETLYKEYFNMDKDEYRQIINHCWKERHDFLFLRLDDVETNKYFRNFNRLVLSCDSVKKYE